MHKFVKNWLLLHSPKGFVSSLMLPSRILEKLLNAEHVMYIYKECVSSFTILLLIDGFPYHKTFLFNRITNALQCLRFSSIDPGELWSSGKKTNGK